MGCSHSIPDNHPTLFRAKNVDDNDKTQNCVYLEVKSNNLFILSKCKKIVASWPISCLQRYGFNNEVLLIETGHGCDTGQGLFLFKCHRSTQLFERIKDAWAEIQTQNARAYPPHMSYPHQMSVMTGTTALPSTSYYNTTGSARDCGPLTAGLSYVSGHPSTSNSRYTPPTPGTRGSASSRNTGSQRSLPRSFELQPAPLGRQEMLDRRRINSNAVSFSCQNESVNINHTRHHTVAADCDYQNHEIIDRHENERSRATESSIAYNANSEHVTFRQESPDMPPRGISANSLRSDGDHVPLTPISNSTSGIGSLNGNSTTSEPKCNGSISIPPPINTTGNPQPPPIPSADPWRKQNGWSKPRRSHPRRLRHINGFMRYSPRTSMSARDYVNTANASLDVSGTPLPATAAVVGGNHFSFDFDPRLLKSHSGNSFHHNHNINYVPIEVSTKNGDFYSCGASSASSGLPGTPLTPRTPGGQQFSCEYAEIDHHKTRALSNAFRSRQREKKSRHESTETTALANGNI